MEKSVTSNGFIVSPRSGLFLSLLVTCLVVLSSSLTWAQSLTRAQKVQQAFDSGIAQIFDLFIQNGGESLLVSQDGRKISLKELKTRATSIHFSEHSSLYNSQGLDCKNELSAQWLTAADSPDGSPRVAYTKYNNIESFGTEEWTLLFHETLSALNLVDDEYQISGPMFLLMTEAVNKKVKMTDLLSAPDFKAMAPALHSIVLRSKAPRYKMGSNDLCYKWNGGVGTLQNQQFAGNTTGVGGGGDGESILAKLDLLRFAPDWWKQNNSKNLGIEDQQKFLKAVSSLGIEPLDHSRQNIAFIIPVQLEFKTSQRTGKLAAYFMVDRLKQYRSQNWGGALDMICRHIYTYVLPGKSTQHVVYGEDLAFVRRIIKMDELGRKKIGPFFLKD